MAGEIVQGLRHLGLEPVLVGGMALVVLGSRRVTQDFDFVVAAPGHRLAATLDLFYDRGLQLATRVNEAEAITATLADRKIAAIRLRGDKPESAFFYNPATHLRIDLLFDFPIPAVELAGRATRRGFSASFHIASEPDLLRLKKIARKARAAPGDAEDIFAFSRNAAEGQDDDRAAAGNRGPGSVVVASGFSRKAGEACKSLDNPPWSLGLDTLPLTRTVHSSSSPNQSPADPV